MFKKNRESSGKQVGKRSRLPSVFFSSPSQNKWLPCIRASPFQRVMAYTRRLFFFRWPTHAALSASLRPVRWCMAVSVYSQLCAARDGWRWRKEISRVHGWYRSQPAGMQKSEATPSPTSLPSPYPSLIHNSLLSSTSLILLFIHPMSTRLSGVTILLLFPLWIDSGGFQLYQNWLNIENLLWLMIAVVSNKPLDYFSLLIN